MELIKLGTDYSGIGSPEEALKDLQEEGFLKFESEFACDIDKFARSSHDALHKTKKMYLDITERDHSEVPQLGLYIAGFPCQSFSIAGKGKGFDDVRGTLFFNTADFIRINQPDCFILENVKGLLSHEKGKTYQTIIDLLSNGGGTVNGQMALDFFEDGLGYHIHYKVLNTKEHGIPQNRERIFIVGFKESRDYRFPIKEPLKLKLKDLLEDEVDEKYFLSDKSLKGLLKGQSKPQFTDGKGVARCFTAGGNSGGMHSSMTLITNLQGKDYCNTIRTGGRGSLTDKHNWDMVRIGAMRGRNPKNPKSRKSGLETEQMLEINEKGTSNCLTSVQKDNLVITHNIKQIVKVRKYNVDLKSLQHELKKHKSLSIKEISEKLKVKKTTVEHWFRTDKCFSIPDENIWFELKKLLKIKTNKFDNSITEFEEKLNNYEKSNRVYDVEGIAPTLTTVNTDEKITNGVRIRRLTPLECWRLQGFSDESFYKAQKVNSDTQLYKQAGNSITKNVIKKVIYNIYK
jgi:DNA (cytosine-5)-methyltransferase 1